MGVLSEEAAGLRALIERLRWYKVTNWSSSKNDTFTDREEVSLLRGAHVASSRYNNGQARHALVLDIDHPAWLVKSSTPGHYHLYVDVPGGINHELYMALLGTLADCGIIEPGYARASQERGASMVRLPWVKKGSQVVSGNQTGVA
jgi:hypothetical protein